MHDTEEEKTREDELDFPVDREEERREEVSEGGQERNRERQRKRGCEYYPQKGLGTRIH